MRAFRLKPVHMDFSPFYEDGYKLQVLICFCWVTIARIKWRSDNSHHSIAKELLINLQDYNHE